MPNSVINAIVMTYNSEKTLWRCLESLNGRVDRVLVVDGRFKGFPGKYNSSRDGTLELVNDFKVQADSEICLYVYPDNVEPVYEYEKRSLAMALVPLGEWILFVDSDEEIVMWPGKRSNLDLSNVTGYRIHGMSGKYAMYRKSPGLRFTINPHYGTVDDYGEVNFESFPVLELVDVRHQPGTKSAKTPDHIEYLNWLWQNPVMGDRLDYDKFLNELNWIPVGGR